MLRPAVVLGIVVLLGGCAPERQWTFVESRDVALDLPRSTMLGQGVVRPLVEEAATDFERALAAPLDAAIEAFDRVEGRAESARRRDWRIFGPFADPERPGVWWRVELFGSPEQTAFVVEAGNDPDRLWTIVDGTVEEDGEARKGALTVFVDHVAEVEGWIVDPERRFAGTAEVAFARSIDGPEQRIDVAWTDFSVGRAGAGVLRSQGPLHYERSIDGSGSVAFAIEADDDDSVLGGVPAAAAAVALKWRADQVAHARSSSPAGSGPLVLDECFAPDGQLVYGDVNEPYREALAELVVGDRSQCAFSDADLP